PRKGHFAKPLAKVSPIGQPVFDISCKLDDNGFPWLKLYPDSVLSILDGTGHLSKLPTLGIQHDCPVFSCRPKRRPGIDSIGVVVNNEIVGAIRCATADKL